MGRRRTGSKGRKGPVRSQHRPGIEGTVRVMAGRAEVETAVGTYRVTGRGLHGAMDRDVVAVSLVRGPGGKRRAVVDRVIEHAHSSVVGTYAVAGPLGVVRPLDARIKSDFFVLPEDDSAARLGVEPGDIVAARIEVYPTGAESGIVSLTRLIGDESAPDLGIQCVMARFGLVDGYAGRALAAAGELALDVEGALDDPIRRDLRERFLVTIDPADALDFDDAVSVERTAKGGWRLGVHIADVSHYVRWEDAVDLEARSRATSVYLADRVLPMLPAPLSEDLCSLRPNEDRLAMTVDIELSPSGSVRSYEIFPSAIRSRVRLDYDAADAVLAGVGEDGTEETRRAADAIAAAAAAGADLARFLRDADDLARARRRLRRQRGSIDFETVEVHALLDEEGLPQRIVSRRRTAATSLIEEAMLLANECVAEYLVDAGAPAAFRVHEPPAPDALAGAARVLREMGALSPAQALDIEAGDPRAIEAAVEAAHGTAVEPLANALLLRAMQRALYKPENEGHFALGAPAYCHFTSPIRRYPDLLVHRQLKVQLARAALGRADARRRAPALTGTGPEAMERILPQLCRHASERERIADAAAHASQKVKVAQYFGDRIGERVSGSVSWVGELGAFVRLDDTGAEGLIRMAALGDEWWDLDERSLTITGTTTGTVIGLGTRVVAEVKAVDVLRGHVDLALVHAGRTAIH
ncbi:MAG: VacB/RNase II family 3'-5' exoribonuclease [Coriobacteriaceae bacterium]|nr:VacB/RNase II family 3'-5' exoribonuclease [Coriobacteriaceae bacterium]